MIPVLVVGVNVRINLNVRVLDMDSSFDIRSINISRILSEIRYVIHETDDRYIVPKLRLGGTIPPLFHMTYMTYSS
jgi:hypothetical protein